MSQLSPHFSLSFLRKGAIAIQKGLERSTSRQPESEVGIRRFRENRVPWGFTLANQLVFKKVRAALGLDRCRILFTGSAPISKETLEYFMSLNMPLMELYGMSESSGPHTVSTNHDFHISRSARRRREGLAAIQSQFSAALGQWEAIDRRVQR